MKGAAKGRTWEGSSAWSSPCAFTTPRPTAVLAMSDQLAVGVLAGARELGLRVPDDVSVVGWDDSPAARDSAPALTGIAQSLHEQGLTCARLLLAATRGELAAGDLVHLAPWRLVVRESTGPPPADQRRVLSASR